MLLSELVWDRPVGGITRAMVGEFVVDKWNDDTGNEVVCVHVPASPTYILWPRECDWVDVACWLAQFPSPEVTDE